MTLIVGSKYYSHIKNEGDEIVALDEKWKNRAVEHITKKTDTEKKLVLVVTHAMTQYYDIDECSDESTEFVNRFRVYRGYITGAHEDSSGNVEYIRMVNASADPLKMNRHLIIDIIRIDGEENPLERFEK